MRWPLVFNDFFLDKSFIASEFAENGKHIKFVSNSSPARLLAQCEVCKKEKWTEARGLYDSSRLAWHKSYRCMKCVNVGRKLSQEQKNSIGKANSEACKKNPTKNKNFKFFIRKLIITRIKYLVLVFS